MTHPDGRESSGQIEARPGAWGRLTSVRAHRLVHDIDVELACDNSGGHNPCVVGDPIVAAALTGFAVEARPFLVEGGRRIALEALVQFGRLESVETYRTGARYLGAIELPTYRGALIAVSGTVLSPGAGAGRVRGASASSTRAWRSSRPASRA